MLQKGQTLTREQTLTVLNTIESFKAISGVTDHPAEVQFYEMGIANLRIQYNDKWYCYGIGQGGWIFHFELLTDFQKKIKS